jgi:DnaJ-class molecular chaperone
MSEKGVKCCVCLGSGKIFDQKCKICHGAGRQFDGPSYVRAEEESDRENNRRYEQHHSLSDLADRMDD